MPDQPTVIERHAARVLLIDPDNRLLLFQCRSGIDDGEPVWITPGGGLQRGETHEQAALRELHEETGLAGVRLEAAVWTRVHTFPWDGRLVTQHERFYLCRTPHTKITRRLNQPEELHYLLTHRWWTINEIKTSPVQFAPRRLATLTRHLLTHGPPKQPIDVGV